MALKTCQAWALPTHAPCIPRTDTTSAVGKIDRSIFPPLLLRPLSAQTPWLLRSGAALDGCITHTRRRSIVYIRDKRRQTGKPRETLRIIQCTTDLLENHAATAAVRGVVLLGFVGGAAASDARLRAIAGCGGDGALLGTSLLCVSDIRQGTGRVKLERHAARAAR